MKAIAIERGWRHDSHSILFSVADRLALETGGSEIVRLFRTAGETHKNFYEGTMTKEDVAGRLAKIRTLLEILSGLSTDAN